MTRAKGQIAEVLSTMILNPFRKLSKLAQKNRLNQWFYQTFKSNESFSFARRDYEYVYHRHNVTWMNERAVELSIVWDFVERHDGAQILEVGNVLSHYFSIDHDVVDKYERAARVINQDIVDYQPEQKYDLIVSISTLEHVGWDEQPRDPLKIPKAVDNLERLLKPGGKMLLTFPLGYNSYLDELLYDGVLRFDEQRYLKRMSSDNRWHEVEWHAARGTSYNRPYFYANALVVATHARTEASPIVMA